MESDSNLDHLLRNMAPEEQNQMFVFLTSHDGFSAEERAEAMMIFEVEGTTIIINASLTSVATEHDPKWSMITLKVKTDLKTVGFLAAITRKLADAGIPVNAVSAFYHDHLFVPWERRNEAMDILHSFENPSV
jgi:uncharacterized protein